MSTRRFSSCRGRSIGWRTCANCGEIAEYGGRSRRAGAGFPADRARFRAKAEPDATGDAVARSRAAGLLRAVPGIADRDSREADLATVPVAGVGGALLL